MGRCPSCWYQFLTVIAMIKAIIARLIFAVHSFVAIWRVTDVKENPTYWCLGLALMALIMEGVLTLWKKRGAEWKWFSPVVFLYLCSVVPAIWFLELDLLHKRIQASDLALAQNSTLPPRGYTHIQTKTRTDARGLAYVIPVVISDDEWAKILEQLLLLFLIVGRWLLPKGDITRDQLSQLLLVNIGMAADIIELFEAFNETQVRHNWTLTVIIMSLWTGSLFQFTMVVTATRARKPRVAITKRQSSVRRISCLCCETEIWAIVTSIILQDGPFLVLRMLLILRYQIMSYMNLFFTCKNSLVMLLQLYRILVVLVETKRKKRKEKFQEDTEVVSLTTTAGGGIRHNRKARQTNTVIPKSPSKPVIPKDLPFKQYCDQSAPKPKLRAKYPVTDRFLTDDQSRRLSFDPIQYICSDIEKFDTQSIVSYYSLTGLKTKPVRPFIPPAMFPPPGYHNLPPISNIAPPNMANNNYANFNTFANVNNYANVVSHRQKTISPFRKMSIVDGKFHRSVPIVPVVSKAKLASLEDISICSSVMFDNMSNA